jgi:predicted tellurium resistance membrane protein TerC
MWFGQQFDLADIATIGLLVVLEGLLSIDNALVLGLLAKRLPKEQQKRALTYGLVGAFAFRVIAIIFAAMLLKWHLAKFLGGAYLVYVAGKYFFFESRDKVDEKIVSGPEGEPILLDQETGRQLSDAETEEEIKARIPLHVPGLEPDLTAEPTTASGSAVSIATSTAPAKKYAGFWPTVAVIELTDIAFAIDSILAAMALVGAPPNADEPHPKLWVVVTGGMLGVILMRFAAVLFIKMLERFPRFETSAYLLVFVIGGKLIADYAFNKPGQPAILDFHHPDSPAFWTFWIVMLVCFSIGFIPKRRRVTESAAT